AADGGRQRALKKTTPSPSDYSVSQKEHYLSNNDIAFVRPGLKIIVNSVTIGSDRKPVVDLSITDSLDQPLDRLGKTTPGAVSITSSLGCSTRPPRQYTSYITRTQTAAPPSANPGVTAVQATSDSGGTFTDLDTGHASYKFGNALPATFDQTKTHTLGIYST